MCLMTHPIQAQSNGIELIAMHKTFDVMTAGTGGEPQRAFAANPSRPIHGNTPVARLRSVIASAEAGRMGYNAVQHGARIKPPNRPVQMTVQDIYDWIDATPNQQHAIGRYQFIPNTLRGLMQRAGIDPSKRFSPALQDQLADMLLRDAGLVAFSCGRITRKAFMNRLARIWAGLPTSSGRSAYDGLAGNAATISWRRFEAGIAQSFPAGVIKANAQGPTCT